MSAPPANRLPHTQIATLIDAKEVNQGAKQVWRGGGGVHGERERPSRGQAARPRQAALQAGQPSSVGRPRLPAACLTSPPAFQSVLQYRFSYTLAEEGKPTRTVFQSIAIGNNGRINRFFTVNASCTEADREAFEPVLQQIVASFTPPPLPSL